MVVIVNETNFDEAVLQAARPVLVDFWAEWCGPCKVMLPVVDELAGEFEGRVDVVKINVDNSPSISARYGIRNIPTILFFKNGEVVDKQVGAVPRNTLLAKLNALL
jgi:thioredoxin 1